MLCPPGAQELLCSAYYITELQRKKLVKNEANFRWELLFHSPGSHACISFFFFLNPSSTFSICLAAPLVFFFTFLPSFFIFMNSLICNRKIAFPSIPSSFFWRHPCSIHLLCLFFPCPWLFSNLLSTSLLAHCLHSLATFRPRSALIFSSPLPLHLSLFLPLPFLHLSSPLPPLLLLTLPLPLFSSR